MSNKGTIGTNEVKEVDFLEAMSGQGTEAVEQYAGNNYLKMAQALTPEVVEGEIPSGVFFDSVSLTNLGKEIVVNIVKSEIVWMVWRDENKGGGLKGIHPVEGIPVIREGYKLYDQEGDEVVETFNYYVIVKEHEDLGLLIFSLTSSQLKYARKWNSMIANLRTPKGNKAGLAQGLWKVPLVLDSNSKGQKWFGIGKEGTCYVKWEDNIDGAYFEKYTKDAMETVKVISQNALKGPTQQQAIEHETLKDV